MLLKRVTMSGFKSFADKVDFDFGPGVTCIVGPNGCGKSNVVDAVKWVLGEQSAKSLRGRQMVDMIFNGSSARKSASVAQIELVFDNTDHCLASDQTEVSVMRKLYRSGESEYLINNESARLKDIRELFMDTGVGTTAYSIIEQGRVDVLLQSSPTERRTIFEEAAGISKFKARKKEAQRKMERTEQNLLRVEDIVEEVEKRLRSVKLQAGKARNFLEYQGRLNELRSSYSMAEFHRFTQKINGLESQILGASDQVTELTAKIDHHEAEEAELTAKLDRIAEELTATDNALMEARSERSAYQERIESARQRLCDQEELLARAVQREEVDSRKFEEGGTELSHLEAAVDEYRQRRASLDLQMGELREKDQSFARDLTQAQSILEDEKAGIIELLRKSAQTHNEIIRLNTHRESLIGQKGRLHQRVEQIREELHDQIRQRSQLELRLEEVAQLIETETARLEEKKAEAERVAQSRQSLAEQLANEKERRSALVSRQELLTDLERKKDGVGAGVRQLLDAKDSPLTAEKFECVVGLVADVFDTDVVHAPIVEAALGDADQYLVVRRRQALLDALKGMDELPDRVTAFCLDQLAPAINERDFSGKTGFVARVIDLVRYPAEMTYLAKHLLGRTVVVEDLAAAQSLAREDFMGHRFVTLAGELVDSSGRVSLGPPSSRAGLISRKSELRDIEIQLAVHDEEIASLTDRLNRFRAEAEHLDRIQQELRGAIYESNTAKVEAQAALRGVREVIERLSNEQPLIAQEVEAIEREIHDVATKSEEGDKSLKAIEEENQQREDRVASYQVRIDEVSRQRGEVQDALTELKVEAGQVAEKQTALSHSIGSLKRQLAELEEAIATSRADQEQCQRQIDDAKRLIEEGGCQLDKLDKLVRQKEQEAIDLRKRREEYRIEIEQLGQAVKSARSKLSEVEKERHEIQMALTETKVRRDELASRVKNELDIDLAQRYSEYEHAEQDWEVVEEEIAELRGKIDRLGNVNLDAIQELDELTERHKFLTGQRDDLSQSLRQLEQLIEKLNDESLDRFKKAFDAIRAHFRTLFRKLFGGGKADVILEDPENVLDCGIEILAQPPGKELQSISLMSGGEKTMTAIALLMSIFKSRPAPFAILDEVDAALDEANNERFNQIVTEFVEDSQFVIITHSKRTMSIGDRLYGITMQEPGVSTRVSVELANAQVA